MSEIVRLHVPPFAPTAPTSLAALRRPLIQAEQTRCAANCQPCDACQAEQDARVADAAKASADQGLRLSQLIETAVLQYADRIEAQQSALIATVLATVLPDLANITLRETLQAELSAALSDPLKAKGRHTAAAQEPRAQPR